VKDIGTSVLAIKDDGLAFSTVINEITTFLEPVYDAIIEQVEWQNFGDCNANAWGI